MQNKKIENLVAIGGLGCLLLLFAALLFESYSTVIFLVVASLIALVGLAYLLRNLPKNMKRACLCVALCATVLLSVAYAASIDGITTPESICESPLQYVWNTDLSAQFEGDLSTDGAAGDVTVSNETSKVEDGRVVSGSFTVTISATSSGKSTQGSGCDAKDLYAGKTTTTLTITNTDTIRPVKIKNIKDSNGNKLRDDTQLAANQTFTMSVAATPNSKEDASITKSLTFTVEFEFLDSVTLSAQSSEYVNYTFTTDEAGKEDVVYTVEPGAEPQTYSFPSGTKVYPVIDAGTYVLYGWRLSNGNLIPADGVVTVDADITMYPILLTQDEYNEAKVFQVGTSGDVTKQYLFWDDAVREALASDDKTIILMRDYTLPANLREAGTTFIGSPYVQITADGINYIIPEGVKFTVPYDAEDKGIFVGGTQYAPGEGSGTMAVYRTLTVPSGAKITCDGMLNVNSKRKETGQGHVGYALGYYGKIQLQGSGTQLLVNGTLFCYGYISGSGTVEVNGTIHELMELASWPGASNLLSWNTYSEDYAMFPLPQYFVQNVEAPLRLNGGCKEMLEAVITASSTTIRQAMPFVSVASSTEGLFLLSDNAYILRENDLETNRTHYSFGSIDGQPATVSFGSLIIDASSYMPGLKIDSAANVLPLPNNLGITIENQVSVAFGNRMALLPGAYLHIAEGGTLNLSNQLFTMDKNDWNNTMYYQGSKKNYAEVSYYNTLRGTNGTLVVDHSSYLRVDGTLNISGSGSIYTTSGATNVDKILTGIGVINHSGTVAAANLMCGYNKDTLVEFSVSNAVAKFAGITDQADANAYNEIGNNTYHGVVIDGVNWWYTGKESNQGSCVAGSEQAAYIRYHCGAYDAANSATYVELAKPVKHNWGGVNNCECQTCGILRFYATNINLGNNLDLLFAIPAALRDDWTGCYVVFSCNGVESAPIPYDKWTLQDISNEFQSADGKNYLVFSYNGLAAKQMCDEVSVVIYDAEKNPVTTTLTTSIQDYAVSILEKSDNALLKQMVTDMLNYGAACQVQFGYKAENLANTVLNKLDRNSYVKVEGASVTTNSDATVSIAGRNLITSSRIQFMIALHGVANGDAVTVTYTNRLGDQITLNLVVATVNNATCITIDSLVPADYASTLTLAVKGTTLTTSIADYLADNSPAGNTAHFAFGEFAVSAKAYLDAKDSVN